MRTAAAIVLAVLLAASCSKKDKSDQTKDSPSESTESQPADETPVTVHSVDAELASKIYESSISTLDGDETSLGSYREKALLVVNVASKCGLTPQYAQLEELQDTYAEEGFTVVGIPCNQFGGQEPGSPEEIKEFCSTTYGVSFPMMEKVEVNGGGRHPIYEVLTKYTDGAGEAGDIEWNFEKFLIAPGGEKIARFRPQVEPKDPVLIATLEDFLGK